MICATPVLPCAPWVSDGQFTVLAAPSVQTPGAALLSQVVKFCVVPELSERCATVIDVLGSFALGLSAAIAGSFHVLIWRWKIFAVVSAESWRFFTPDTL